MYKTKRDQRFERMSFYLIRQKNKKNKNKKQKQKQKQTQKPKNDTKWRSTSFCDGRKATQKHVTKALVKRENQSRVWRSVCHACVWYPHSVQDV